MHDAASPVYILAGQQRGANPMRGLQLSASELINHPEARTRAEHKFAAVTNPTTATCKPHVFASQLFFHTTGFDPKAGCHWPISGLYIFVWSACLHADSFGMFWCQDSGAGQWCS